MKKCKRALLLLFCLIFMQAVVVPSALPCKEVYAAQKKSGLVKERGKYYFYEDGKKVKNTWRTVKTTSNGKKVSNKYYFGKNGAAYAGNAEAGRVHNIVVKKINGKYYGFDTKGRMVKGVYANTNGKFYVFNSRTGVYDKKTTQKYRNAAKRESDSANLRKLLGKPQKTKTSSSCIIFGGTDIVLTYSHVVVTLCADANNEKEIVLGVWPR